MGLLGRRQLAGPQLPGAGPAVAAYTLTAMVAGLANLAFVPLWVHRFGFAEYGAYAVTWAIAIASGTGCAGWIRQAGLRSAGETVRIIDLPRWSLAMSFAVAAGAAGTGAFLIGVLSPRGAWLASFMAIAIMANQLVSTELQRNERKWLFAGSEMCKAAAILTATLVLAGPGALGGAEAMMLGVCVGHLATLGFVSRSDRRSPRGPRVPAQLADWWSYGWPLSVWVALSPLLLYVNRLVLQVTVEEEVVGAFAALSDLAIRGLAAGAAPVLIATQVWAMRLHNSGQQGKAETGMRHLEQVALGLTLVTVMTVGGIRWAFPDVWLWKSLPWSCVVLLVGAGCLWQVAIVAHKPLEFARRSRSMLHNLVLALLVELVVTVLLVSPLGPTGAAWGLLAGVATYWAASHVGVARVPRRLSPFLEQGRIPT